MKPITIQAGTIRRSLPVLLAALLLAGCGAPVASSGTATPNESASAAPADGESGSSETTKPESVMEKVDHEALYIAIKDDSVKPHRIYRDGTLCSLPGWGTIPVTDLADWETKNHTMTPSDLQDPEVTRSISMRWYSDHPDAVREACRHYFFTAPPQREAFDKQGRVTYGEAGDDGDQRISYQIIKVTAEAISLDVTHHASDQTHREKWVVVPLLDPSETTRTPADGGEPRYDLKSGMSMDEVFLEVVRTNKPVMREYSDQYLIDYGRAICEAVNSGAAFTVGDYISDIPRTLPEGTSEDVIAGHTYTAGVGVEAYCPAYVSAQLMWEIPEPFIRQ